MRYAFLEICRASTHKEVVKELERIDKGRNDLITEGLEYNLEPIRKIAKELEKTYYLGQTAKDSKRSIISNRNVTFFLI
jgi:hypothetical protein